VPRSNSSPQRNRLHRRRSGGPLHTSVDSEIQHFRQFVSLCRIKGSRLPYVRTETDSKNASSAMPAPRLTSRRSTPTSPRRGAGTPSTICRSASQDYQQARHRPAGLRRISSAVARSCRNEYARLLPLPALAAVAALAGSSLGDSHAYPPKYDFGRVRPRACLSDALDRQRAILFPVLAISVVLAVLRGGCRGRHRRDDRHRTVLGAHRSAAALLLLRLLRAALLSAIELLPARVLFAADLLLWATPSRAGSRRWHRLILRGRESAGRRPRYALAALRPGRPSR
jgi:hypothetical protein